MGPSAENFLAKYGSLHILTQRKIPRQEYGTLCGEIGSIFPTAARAVWPRWPDGSPWGRGVGRVWCRACAMVRGARHLGGIRLNAAAISSAALTLRILQGIGQ